jgi:HD-GYP domain-containing protein (c-di-GMP phosphodiesterase class II)
MKAKKKSQASASSELKNYREELEQYRREHRNLMTLLNVTRNISRELQLDRLLKLIMDEVINVLNCDRCTVFVLDRDKGELWSRVAHGENEIRFPSHLGIAGYVATTGEVLNIPDAYADERFNPEIDRKTGYHTRNILTAPMRNSLGEMIGVFQALNKAGGPFNQDDEELLDAISVISASQIENAQLYAEQKKTFDSFVETLASTIDARDPMTAGHSKRIAMYADEIAKVVNLSAQSRDVLRTAALLHDYGKIAVREAVLTKDGKLTDEEFKHIQSHPHYTKSILEKINFSRELREVPLVAASHHEKLDGSGYPSGLANGQIPELGKILAVVDVFDALTSKRHYRDRMEFHKVIQILDSEAGTHFEEKYVIAFKKIKLDRLLFILEEENNGNLSTKDMAFLSSFDTGDLLAAADLEQAGSIQRQAWDVFTHYYSRSYSKGHG